MSRDLPSLGPRGEGWVAIQVLLLAAVAVLGPMGRVGVDGALALVAAAAGLILLAAGVALLAWGSLALGRDLTPLPRPREDAVLVDRGAFALVRHPLYGGLLLGALGWSVLWLSPPALLGAAGLAVFFGLKSRREEAWLNERFDGYAAYAARTRRFIPWVW